MKVYLLTHGKHQAGGKTAETYDGPLTDESKTKIAGISLPQVEVVYRGIMKRHADTAQAAGLTNVIPVESCGHDKLMFACVENGDTKIVEMFEAFLNEEKDKGRQTIMIITSRFFPVLFKFLQSGGQKKLGPFNTFCKVIEMAATWENTKIGVMESGVLHQFEY